MELDITQSEMAERAGIPVHQIQSIEDGRAARGLDVKVKKIALALGVDRQWLMWGGELVPDPEGPGGLKCAIRDLNPEPAGLQSRQVRTMRVHRSHSERQAA